MKRRRVDVDHCVGDRAALNVETELNLSSMNEREFLIDALNESRHELARRYVDAIAGAVDEAALDDLVEAAERILDLVVESLRHDNVSTTDLFELGRPTIHRALQRGVSPVELQISGRHILRFLWDALIDAAGDDPAKRGAVMDLMPGVMDMVDATLDVADAAMREAQETRATSTQAVESALVDALISGRALGVGQELAAAERHSLGSGDPLVVVVARSRGTANNPYLPQVVSTMLRRALRGDHAPALAVLDNKVVIVRALPDREARGLADRVADAARRLAREGISVGIGGSAAHDGIAACPDAYAEALTALSYAEQGDGVLAYWSLTALDYLLVRAREATAWRLVPAPIREFIAEDLGNAGPLVSTVLAYLDANLQVTGAAKLLGVHRGTVQYRLRRVSELTGCDLRNVADLQELVVAIRLASASTPHPGLVKR